jgi:hypothetical protein
LSNVIKCSINLLLIATGVQDWRCAPWASAVPNLARLLVHPAVHALHFDDVLAVWQIDEPDQNINKILVKTFIMWMFYLYRFSS